MLRILSSRLRWITAPFSLLYQFITSVRNWLFDIGARPVYQSTIYTINIGNLTLGGTGKTPHIEYLIRLCANKYTLAVLSRGYGRKTKGFGQAHSASDAAEIGDEPLQIFQKFGRNTSVFVCEKRAIGLQTIEKIHPNPQLILLDDAYQHRAVRPTLNLLLTDFGRLFYNDYVLPLGLLRESKEGAKRANGIIVTKCPASLTSAEQKGIVQKIQRYTAPNTPVFFSTFEYSPPLAYFESEAVSSFPSAFWLVSGIAQPKLFEEAARNQFNVVGHSTMGDHHEFTPEEVIKWAEISKNYPILTTEKDFVKLKPLLEQMNLTQCHFYYWPIEVKFFDKRFDEFLLTEVMRQPHA